MKRLKLKLGSVNLKFLGTRLLLLATQLLVMGVSYITEGTPQSQVVPARFRSCCMYSDFQAELLLAAVLNIIAFVVVCFNSYSWALSKEQEALLYSCAPDNDNALNLWKAVPGFEQWERERHLAFLQEHKKFLHSRSQRRIALGSTFNKLNH